MSERQLSVEAKVLKHIEIIRQQRTAESVLDLIITLNKYATLKCCEVRVDQSFNQGYWECTDQLYKVLCKALNVK